MTTRPSAQLGFSDITFLVGLVVLVMAALFTVISHSEDARQQRLRAEAHQQTQDDLALYRRALTRFQERFRRYPSATEGLEVLANVCLLDQPLQCQSTNFVPVLPKDAWNQAYVYTAGSQATVCTRGAPASAPTPSATVACVQMPDPQAG